MEYVSAEWIVDDTGHRYIKAIGDDGNEYFVPEADTDVPPWPEFLKTKGAKAIKAAPEVKKSKK
jgi:hypothetical protein